ncbi:MAG: carboxypeptidase-like regulatory domain-containing protein [Isosphaeraceae bacterium]
MGTPGLNKGLGRIKLAGTGGHLAGTVVGSDGRPVADAEVFNRGNGLEPVSTRTDSQGRFRLEKLFPGRKSAFARKQGHRFTTVLSEGDRDDLTIRLLRTDEPPPAWKPEAGPSADEQQALARRILTRLWEEVGGGRTTSRSEELAVHPGAPPMARIDPALGPGVVGAARENSTRPSS